LEARVELELELEPDKKKNEPSSNKEYSLKIGSFTPLPQSVGDWVWDLADEMGGWFWFETMLDFWLSGFQNTPDARTQNHILKVKKREEK